jgi:hypothetical protein
VSILGGSKHPPAKGKDDKDEDDDKSSSSKASKTGTQQDKDREGEDKHPSDQSRIAGDKRTVEQDREASDPEALAGTRKWDNVQGQRDGLAPDRQVPTGSPTQNEPNARSPMDPGIPPVQTAADASTLNHPLTPRIVSYAKLANDNWDEYLKMSDDLEVSGVVNETTRTKLKALRTAFEGHFRALVDLCMGDNDVKRPV